MTFVLFVFGVIDARCRWMRPALCFWCFLCFLLSVFLSFFGLSLDLLRLRWTLCVFWVPCNANNWFDACCVCSLCAHVCQRGVVYFVVDPCPPIERERGGLLPLPCVKVRNRLKDGMVATAACMFVVFNW